MSTKSKSKSSFWSDRFFGGDTIDWENGKVSTLDLYKLASAKRAIGNFVNIVTNKNIPVKFRSDNHSYTDGKTVVIGSNISNPKDFDVAVGLSLHEGSHIKLSDFGLLAKLGSIIPQNSYQLGDKIGYGSDKVQRIIKDLWNVVEDRRIDNYIYSTAPGYRGYYIAMYDKYFNNDVIDTALESDKYTEENLNSYMFRIINIHNKKTRLSALKTLKQIYKLIGLGTIDRLKTSQDAFDVAIDVFNIMATALEAEQSETGDGDDNKDDSNEQKSEKGKGKKGGESSPSEKGDETESERGDNEGDETEEGDEESNGGDDEEGDEENEGNGGDEYDYEGDLEREKEVKKFNEALEGALEKAIEQQNQFLRDEIEKESLSQTDADQMDTIEEAGVELNRVGKDYNTYGDYNNQGIECVVAKKLTRALLDSEDFPLTNQGYDGKASTPYADEIIKGIQLGTALGKKLQVRAESRTTVFNRQKNGRIDKRMVSSLGFGNENVFYYNEVDQYNKANLHFSIDASSSMSGNTWKNTMINVTALCRAVDMIQNLDIQVSFRTTSETSLPYIIMAYDSRVDKFSKVRDMFPCLTPRGTTPEGLCFEAIEKNFIPSSNSMDSYFVNISDGEPYFGGQNFHYSGTPALNHTREQVKKLRMKGIQVLSYFVSNYDGEHHDFKVMYGKSARFVDVTNVAQITKTMNELFLKK